MLSQIVLDSTAASDQIPKDTPGRFMLNDSRMSVFQSYLFDEFGCLYGEDDYD